MEVSELKMIEMPVSSLNGYDKNPRKNDAVVARMVESIKEFGFRIPVVAKSDGSVVDGHLRLKAAQRMGMKSVPVVLADELTDAQVKAFRLLANRSANWADWDEDLLRQELADLKDMDFDLSLTGFDADEISSMLDLPLDVGGLTDPDEVPEPPVVPVTKPGDVWVLGNHRLMCGDSTSIDAVEKLMAGQKADMVFTDPPYGVAYEGGHNAKKRQQIKNDALEGENLTGLFHGALTVAYTVTHDHAAFYVWFASGKSVETFAAFSDLPLSLRAVIQWYKVRSGLGAFMAQYIPNCEPCIYAFKTGSAPQWFGPTDEKTVWELKKEARNDYHPTQKPVELPERAINNSSKPGQIILDLFGGSGSTLIACEKTGRNARLMELDPKYCDVIVKRWEDFTGKKAVLETKSAVDSVGHN